MTPAVELLEAERLPFRLLKYKTRSATNIGVAVADELALEHSQVFKTLVTSSPQGALFVAVIPVAATLDLKKFAAAAQVKKLDMAEQKVAERATGYLKGAISPLGQRTLLPTTIDGSAFDAEKVYVSAGKRGVELEIAPQDLKRLAEASIASIC